MSFGAKLATGVCSPKSVIWHLLKRRNQRRATSVMSADWDTLILLDGCRADLFEVVSDLDGEYETVRSLGTHTGEFLSENFGNGVHFDTVYLSANPQVVNHGVDTNFHRCEFLWESHWDDELRTVPPERVSRRLVDAQEEYPHKRLIAHYIQPHYPFIGQTGRAIEHGSMTGDGLIATERDHDSIWNRLEAGEVSKDAVWAAYRENLKIAFDSLADIVPRLTGKTVVTSDHGNALGEWGIYGHPGGKHIESLYLVPWLEFDADERREIVSDPPEHTQAQDVEERLEALGYAAEE